MNLWQMLGGNGMAAGDCQFSIVVFNKCLSAYGEMETTSGNPTRPTYQVTLCLLWLLTIGSGHIRKADISVFLLGWDIKQGFSCRTGNPIPADGLAALENRFISSEGNGTEATLSA